MDFHLIIDGCFDNQIFLFQFFNIFAITFLFLIRCGSFQVWLMTLAVLHFSSSLAFAPILYFITFPLLNCYFFLIYCQFFLFYSLTLFPIYPSIECVSHLFFVILYIFYFDCIFISIGQYQFLLILDCRFKIIPKQMFYFHHLFFLIFRSFSNLNSKPFLLRSISDGTWSLIQQTIILLKLKLQRKKVIFDLKRNKIMCIINTAYLTIHYNIQFNIEICNHKAISKCSSSSL